MTSWRRAFVASSRRPDRRKRCRLGREAVAARRRDLRHRGKSSTDSARSTRAAAGRPPRATNHRAEGTTIELSASTQEQLSGTGLSEPARQIASAAAASTRSSPDQRTRSQAAPEYRIPHPRKRRRSRSFPRSRSTPCRLRRRCSRSRSRRRHPSSTDPRVGGSCSSSRNPQETRRSRAWYSPASPGRRCRADSHHHSKGPPARGATHEPCPEPRSRREASRADYDEPLPEPTRHKQ